MLLVERAEITSGSTFHSAGLVGQLRASLPLTRMMMHSVDVYRRLQAEAEETGRSPGWTEVGSLRIASTAGADGGAHAASTVGRRRSGSRWSCSAGEAHERFPLMDPTGVLGAVWLPTDGHLDPSGLTYAFIGGARRSA